MRRLQRRVTKLEAVCAPEPTYPTIICVNDNGLIYDDGTEPTRPWVGRHHAEIESTLPPWYLLQVMVGIDPRSLLGSKQ